MPGIGSLRAASSILASPPCSTSLMSRASTDPRTARSEPVTVMKPPLTSDPCSAVRASTLTGIRRRKMISPDGSQVPVSASRSASAWVTSASSVSASST